MISIVKNKEIPLDIPSFTCDDNSVGEHLNNHPLTKLLNCYGFLCIIGRPGQGKTSLAVSLITQKSPKFYKKTHHHIIILMPTNSINSMEKNPFKQLPDENFYNELNDSNITSIYDRICEYSSKDEKTLLFIDDMTSDLKRSKTVVDTLKKMIFNRRHLKLNLIITSQSYVNIPLDIRKNITNCIIFKPAKKEMELLFNELVETKKDIYLEIMKTVYDEKHNFLFVNVPTQAMFRNWDSIVYNDDSNIV
jgi:hypothetical protein